MKVSATKANDQLGTLVEQQLTEIRAAGTYKTERIITSKQQASINVAGRAEPVLNFCANNYLGLCDNKDIAAASQRYLDSHGFGLSSVRFICGTQDIHKELEAAIAKFHGTEDTILFSSCFDANAGIFEVLLGDQDAVISDALNHASIIDGVRLCKAVRYRYKHIDMEDLEKCLIESQKQRLRLVVTDGVFSMDGDLAPLDKICDLCDKYNAILMVDESHACGFIGKTGRGTPELFNVMHRVPLINSTLGKALGGASGGYTTGRKDVIELMRQRARPYLFSNTLAPSLTGAYLQVFKMLSDTTQLRDKLEENTTYFRQQMKAAGFTIRGSNVPIAPVMVYDAKVATEMANTLLEQGIYVIGFSYPVVPKGEARIRVQVSAAHSRADLDKCIKAFIEVGKQMKLIQ